VDCIARGAGYCGVLEQPVGDEVFEFGLLLLFLLSLCLLFLPPLLEFGLLFKLSGECGIICVGLVLPNLLYPHGLLGIVFDVPGI